MEWIIILLVGAGIAIFYSSRKKVDDDRAAAVAADQVMLEANKLVPPPRPAMTLPPEGGMSVAIEQDNVAVWVWIVVSEATKQTLSKVMEEPVDQFPLDVEDRNRRLRELMRDWDQDHDSNLYSDRERQSLRETYFAESKKMFLTPDYILLRNMLAEPFCYRISGAQETVDYIDRLKTKVLPKIKTMIQQQSRPTKESFEL